MCEEKWFLEKDGDEEECYWNILHFEDSVLVFVCQCASEAFARRLIGALKWADAAESGLLSLEMDGMTKPKRIQKPRPKTQTKAKPPVKGARRG